MKIKFISAAFLIAAFAFAAFAQSVAITPKKVTYQRPKPLSEYKKTFSVTYPKVKGLSPALNKKVETAIGFEKNFDLNIKEEIAEIQWLEETSFDINYNKNGILDVSLSVSGSGAYPSVYTKTVVVDLKTGNRLKPSDIFSNLAGLSSMVRKTQQAEIKKAQAEYKKDPDAADFNGSEYFSEAKITAKELEHFSVSDKGITFIYDYGFPHVALALQPEGRYFYSWKSMKPYIKPGSLLAKFIK